MAKVHLLRAPGGGLLPLSRQIFYNGHVPEGEIREAYQEALKAFRPGKDRGIETRRLQALHAEAEAILSGSATPNALFAHIGRLNLSNTVLAQIGEMYLRSTKLSDYRKLSERDQAIQARDLIRTDIGQHAQRMISSATGAIQARDFAQLTNASAGNQIAVISGPEATSDLRAIITEEHGNGFEQTINDRIFRDQRWKGPDGRLVRDAIVANLSFSFGRVTVFHGEYGVMPHAANATEPGAYEAFTVGKSGDTPAIDLGERLATLHHAARDITKDVRVVEEDGATRRLQTPLIVTHSIQDGRVRAFLSAASVDRFTVSDTETPESIRAAIHKIDGIPGRLDETFDQSTRFRATRGEMNLAA